MTDQDRARAWAWLVAHLGETCDGEIASLATLLAEVRGEVVRECGETIDHWKGVYASAAMEQIRQRDAALATPQTRALAALHVWLSENGACFGDGPEWETAAVAQRWLQGRADRIDALEEERLRWRDRVERAEKFAQATTTAVKATIADLRARVTALEAELTEARELLTWIIECIKAAEIGYEPPKDGRDLRTEIMGWMHVLVYSRRSLQRWESDFKAIYAKVARTEAVEAENARLRAAEALADALRTAHRELQFHAHQDCQDSGSGGCFIKDTLTTWDASGAKEK